MPKSGSPTDPTDAGASLPGGVPIDCTTVPCPVSHWIDFQLLRLSDPEARKPWWPAAKSLPYSLEPYTAQLPDGLRDGRLDTEGRVHFDNIPAGSCRFAAVEFYADIESFFNK